MNKTLFVIGLVIVGIDAVLLVMNVIESGVAAAIGMLGIGLIEHQKNVLKEIHLAGKMCPPICSNSMLL